MAYIHALRIKHCVIHFVDLLESIDKTINYRHLYLIALTLIIQAIPLSVCDFYPMSYFSYQRMKVQYRSYISKIQILSSALFTCHHLSSV